MGGLGSGLWVCSRRGSRLGPAGGVLKRFGGDVALSGNALLAPSEAGRMPGIFVLLVVLMFGVD